MIVTVLWFDLSLSLITREAQMRGFWADDNLECPGCGERWGTQSWAGWHWRLLFLYWKALVSDALHDDLQDDSVCLPPCHTDAAKPEDVYKFEDRILLAAETPLHFPSRDVCTAVPWLGSLRMLVVLRCSQKLTPDACCCPSTVAGKSARLPQ